MSSSPAKLEPLPTPSRWKRTLTIVVSIAISVVLVVWIVLSNEKSPDELMRDLRTARLLPLLLLVPVSLLSHWFRATRWRRMIGLPVSRFYVYSSVMIGYMLNNVIPRGGEVAKVVNMRRTTGVPVPRLVATVIADRILDVLVLVGFLGLSLAMEGARINESLMIDNESFKLDDRIGPTVLGMSVLGILGLLLVTFFGDGLSRLTHRLLSPIHRGLADRMSGFVLEGARGFAFARDPRQAILATMETIIIWGLYWLTFLLSLYAFRFFPDIGLSGVTVVFTITSLSVVVPSLGGIGVFHKFGEASVAIYSTESALAWVAILHAILFIAVGGLGGMTLWAMQVLRRKSSRASEGNSPLPS